MLVTAPQCCQLSQTGINPAGVEAVKNKNTAVVPIPNISIKEE